MKKGWIILIVIVAVLAIAGLAIGGSYNGLVSKEENVTTQASNVSTMLQRRADLIPNLVNTVKGYAAHEQEAINSVTEARAALVGAKTIEDQSKANDELTGALNRLMVIVENYPDLKANTNFIQLQDELAGTENRIATARKDYNDSVKSYNTQIKKFPTNILAGMFGFDEKAYFEADENANKVPDVNF